MSSRDLSFPIEILDEDWAFPEYIIKTTRDLAQRMEIAKSPKDIEDIIYTSISFIKLIHQKIDTASENKKLVYKVLGVKARGIAELNQDTQIAESWINWYKAKRIEDTAAIRQIESYLPAVPEFRVHSSQFSLRQFRLVVKTNLIPESISYRISQAQAYANAIYNIFCAPSAAPAPGQPLPDDLPVPDLEVIPATRTELGSPLFPKEPYAKFEATIIQHFLASAISDGATSNLLPYVPPEDPWFHLPKDHPINLGEIEGSVSHLRPHRRPIRLAIFRQ